MNSTSSGKFYTNQKKFSKGQESSANLKDILRTAGEINEHSELQEISANFSKNLSISVTFNEH